MLQMKQYQSTETVVNYEVSLAARQISSQRLTTQIHFIYLLSKACDSRMISRWN